MPTTQHAQPERASSQEAFERDLRSHIVARGSDAALVPDTSRVRNGLGLNVLDDLKKTLGLDWETVEHVLGVSARTLQRRRKRGEDLTPAESDRLWRLLHIWHRSTEAFGSEGAARTWLTEPHGLLDGETPLKRLDTEPGLREVEDMLTVIDETAAA